MLLNRFTKPDIPRKLRMEVDEKRQKRREKREREVE